LKLAQQTVLGLPKVPVPKDNPLSRKKIELGRKLFFDRRLSLNNTFSCAMCHIPEQGFTSQEQATAVGIEGRTVAAIRRRSITSPISKNCFMMAENPRWKIRSGDHFWRPTKWAIPRSASSSTKSSACPTTKACSRPLFQSPPTMETVGQAIASYERTLISGNTPFDRWHYGKQPDALSPTAQQGFALFTGKAGCAQCHVIGPQHALFTDHGLHNTGLGYRDSMQKDPETRRVQVAPGIAFDLDSTAIAQWEKPNPTISAFMKSPRTRQIAEIQDAFVAQHRPDGALHAQRRFRYAQGKWWTFTTRAAKSTKTSIR